MSEANPVGVVLCKLAAIMLFVDAAQSVGMVLPTFFQFEEGWLGLLMAFLLMGLAPIGAGLFLWFKSEAICRAMPQSLSISVTEKMTAKDLLTVGVMLLGLYAVLFGLVSVAYTEGRIWPSFASQENSDQFNVYDFASRLRYITQIALGLVLVLGRKSLVTLMFKIRRAGTGAT